MRHAVGTLPSTSSVVKRIYNAYLIDEEHASFIPARGEATFGYGHTKVKVEIGSTMGSFNNSDMHIVQGSFLGESNPICSLAWMTLWLSRRASSPWCSTEAPAASRCPRLMMHSKIGESKLQEEVRLTQEGKLSEH